MFAIARTFLFDWTQRNFKSQYSKQWISTLIFQLFFILIAIPAFAPLVSNVAMQATIFMHLEVYLKIVAGLFVLEMVLNWLTFSLNRPLAKTKKKRRLSWLRAFFSWHLLVHTIITVTGFLLLFVPQFHFRSYFILVSILIVARFFLLTKFLLLFEFYNAFVSSFFLLKKNLKIIFIALMMMFLAVFIFAIVIYNIEQLKINDREWNFFDAIWMVTITVTTVGYGDLIPHTVSGRIVIILLAILGVIFYTSISSIIIKFLNDFFYEARKIQERKQITILEKKIDKVISSQQELIKENELKQKDNIEKIEELTKHINTVKVSGEDNDGDLGIG